MALNDLSAVDEVDGIMWSRGLHTYIEGCKSLLVKERVGYKSLLVKDNVFASVDGFSSIIRHLVLQRCISRTNTS